jgi:hypothetical protein
MYLGKGTTGAGAIATLQGARITGAFHVHVDQALLWWNEGCLAPYMSYRAPSYLAPFCLYPITGAPFFFLPITFFFFFNSHLSTIKICTSLDLTLRRPPVLYLFMNQFT